MDLDNAIKKHAEWKMKLHAAILKKETMDAVSIAKDDCCEFGHWLHGDAKTKWGALSSYRECLSNHAAFHVEAGKVAQAINAKKYTEAESMLGLGTSYTASSSAVGVAIMRLKKEAGI